MPPLRKPHRIAVLVPELHVEGPDAAYQRETALLVWIACIEACQRHPGLAVYDAESMPLQPTDGHFVPRHGSLGATPDDAHFGSTRRDELVWLELTLIPGKASAVKLHALARGGKLESFAALGRKVGDQIEQVLVAWLTARGLGALPRGFEAVSTDDILAVVRVFAPMMVEQARAWSQPVAPAQISEDEGEADVDDDDDDGGEVAKPPDLVEDLDTGVRGASRRPVARTIANRLPPALKVSALRLLELAFREDVGPLIVAIDPDHPQAVFARFVATRDFALLRRAIAAAPGWAWPYGELASKPGDATPLEIVAGAGMAAICRPGQLDVLETAGERLSAGGRIDEALRLVERAVDLHDRDPRAHVALLELHRRTGRRGAWHRQAHRSAYLHGCPMDAQLPWYPDQIQIDLLAADALNGVGRLDEAIALRANRLEGREAAWPRATRVLASWRKQPRFVAWAYAREGAYRGDDARAVEGFGRAEPADDVDLACFLDALVALGREDEVPLAWAQFGLGGGSDGPVARLAAARGLMAAGEWRRGIEELWRVELMQPGRDDHVAIGRCAMLLRAAPLDVLEAAVGDRVAVGASTLARRMSRDIADFVPGAARSSVISRALGKATPIDFDPAWLGGFAAETRSRRAIDELFAQLGGLHDDDGLARGDRLVNRWLEVAFAEAGEDELAQAAAYVAAHALGRYFAATTAAPSVVAGALRTVAGEALALAREHRHALGDREAHALLGALDPMLRRVERWFGSTWLATVERCCGIDERSAGDVTGFAPELATVAARVLGPEEVAVLAASVARLHAERPDGWAAAVAVQAPRLMTHTGWAGVDEWTDAIVAQLAARAIEVDDAIDALHTACYLADGVSASPAIHAARTLLRAGRGPAALAALTGGLHAAPDEAWRDRALASLAGDWNLDVPLDFAKVAAEMFEALQKADPARAEKLGRFAVAFDPSNAEAHRNLGLALAQQGKVLEAMEHLVRGTREQASQILSGVLYQSGKLPDAMAVLDYASRWYVRAEQWLTYGGVAFAALDNVRTVKAYAIAYQLDPAAFDASQLNAYAGVLDEVGDYATCEAIAKVLLAAAGDDVMWQTNAWNHLACACIGQGRFTEATTLAERAVARNPLPDNTAGFAATLERARQRTQPTPPVAPELPPRESIFARLEAGDHAGAAAQLDDVSWRVRRVALGASRFRFASENQLAVTPRARNASAAMLAETIGVTAREEVACRALALQIREQAFFARDPVPRLGDRMTRDSFLAEFRARGGVVLGEPTPAPAPFVDRVVVAGSKVARASDMIALLRDLAALAPTEALAQFDLDDAGYLEVARAWGVAIDADPAIADLIDAGLTKR